jgi:hypothetical protein
MKLMTDASGDVVVKRKKRARLGGYGESRCNIRSGQISKGASENWSPLRKHAKSTNLGMTGPSIWHYSVMARSKDHIIRDPLVGEWRSGAKCTRLGATRF